MTLNGVTLTRMIVRKCVTDAIDDGRVAEKLSKIPCIHVAGTKVRL